MADAAFPVLVFKLFTGREGEREREGGREERRGKSLLKG